MDDRFYHGIIGSTDRICGYNVSALTPWHNVILTAINSPVLDPAKETSAGDLLLFLKVLNTRWPDIPDLRAKFKDKWWWWRLNKAKVLLRELGKLKDWLDSQLSSPVTWEVTHTDKGAGKRLSSPAILALIVSLVSKGNIQLESAWNMRIAEARWYDAVLAELNGADVRFAYDNEELPAAQLESKDEAEIIALAKRELPPAKFQVWLANRKENQRKAK